MRNRTKCPELKVSWLWWFLTLLFRHLLKSPSFFNHFLWPHTTWFTKQKKSCDQISEVFCVCVKASGFISQCKWPSSPTLLLRGRGTAVLQKGSSRRFPHLYSSASHSACPCSWFKNGLISFYLWYFSSAPHWWHNRISFAKGNMQETCDFPKAGGFFLGAAWCTDC